MLGRDHRGPSNFASTSVQPGQPESAERREHDWLLGGQLKLLATSPRPRGVPRDEGDCSCSRSSRIPPTWQPQRHRRLGVCAANRREERAPARHGQPGSPVPGEIAETIDGMPATPRRRMRSGGMSPAMRPAPTRAACAVRWRRASPCRCGTTGPGGCCRPRPASARSSSTPPVSDSSVLKATLPLTVSRRASAAPRCACRWGFGPFGQDCVDHPDRERGRTRDPRRSRRPPGRLVGLTAVVPHATTWPSVSTGTNVMSRCISSGNSATSGWSSARGITVLFRNDGPPALFSIPRRVAPARST